MGEAPAAEAASAHGIRWGDLLVELVAGALIVAIVAGYFPHSSFASEWCRHGLVHLGLLLLPCWLYFRRAPWRASVVIAGMALAFLPSWLGSLRPRALPPAPGQATLRVAVANVYWKNPQRETLFATLRALDADVLVTIEQHEEMIADLGRVGRWQVVHATDPRDWAAIGIYSRLPATAAEDGFGAAASRLRRFVPTEAVTLRTAAGPLRVMAVHPLSPQRPGLAQIRDQGLGAATDFIAAWRTDGVPLLLLGDFNTTTLHPIWSSLLATSGLIEAPGPTPRTWPFALLAPLGGGIDRAVVSPGVRMGPATPFAIPGSDHRGVLYTIAVGEPAP